MRKLLTLCLLFMCCHCIEAIWVNGYVKISNTERLEGQIYVSQCNPATSGVTFSGIGLEDFYTRVMFRSRSQSRRVYEPNDIIEFGFTYQLQDYVFQSFVLMYTSMIRHDRTRNRFLCLMYKGTFSLYQDNEMMQWPVCGPEYVAYQHYYLYSESIGLTKVEVSKSHKCLKNLLVMYGMDKEFLSAVPDTIGIRDIKQVLIDYDIWLQFKQQI